MSSNGFVVAKCQLLWFVCLLLDDDVNLGGPSTNYQSNILSRLLVGLE